MDLSYQEKSILGSLLAMVLIYGYYFVNTLRHFGDPHFEASTVGRLIFTVIALIEIVYHIVLGIEQKPERKDERDILIECKAYRNAYLLLASGVSLLILCEIMAGRIILTPFLILTVNLLLLAMVVGELVKLLTQLFYYRQGLR